MFELTNHLVKPPAPEPGQVSRLDLEG